MILLRATTASIPGGGLVNRLVRSSSPKESIIERGIPSVSDNPAEFRLDAAALNSARLSSISISKAYRGLFCDFVSICMCERYDVMPIPIDWPLSVYVLAAHEEERYPVHLLASAQDL